MSLNTLNELSNEARALRGTNETLRAYAEAVARTRHASIHGNPAMTLQGTVELTRFSPARAEAIETEFQKAIAPFEDHILATMEINFRTEAKKAMMRAEAIEARIAASITIPESLP